MTLVYRDYEYICGHAWPKNKNLWCQREIDHEALHAWYLRDEFGEIVQEVRW